MKRKQKGRLPRHIAPGSKAPLRIAQADDPASLTHASAKAPTTLRRFLEFSKDIRLLVYEEYFSDGEKVIVAPKRHPRTRHSTALLLVSRQIHEETLPIFYQTATLTLNLSPKYHGNSKGFEYWLDNVDVPGGTFVGDLSQLYNFKHIRLVLPKQPEKSFKRYLQMNGGQVTEKSDCWWQYVLPIFWWTASFVARKPGFSVALNLGDITSSPQSAGQAAFASCVDRHYYNDQGWRARDMVDRAEFVAQKLKQTVQRMLPGEREAKAMCCVIEYVGQYADMLEKQVRLEDSERLRSVVWSGDKMIDVFEIAKWLVAGGKGQDIWLVMEPRKQKLR